MVISASSKIVIRAIQLQSCQSNGILNHNEPWHIVTIQLPLQGLYWLSGNEICLIIKCEASRPPHGMGCLIVFIRKGRTFLKSGPTASCAWHICCHISRWNMVSQAWHPVMNPQLLAQTFGLDIGIVGTVSVWRCCECEANSSEKFDKTANMTSILKEATNRSSFP